MNMKELSMEFQKRQVLGFPLLKIYAVYIICDALGEIIYIGSTKNLHQRIASHSRKSWFKGISIYYIECIKSNYRRIEKELIKKAQPRINYVGSQKGQRLPQRRLHITAEKVKRMMTELDIDTKRLSSAIKYDAGYMLTVGHCGPVTLNRLADFFTIDPKDLLI